MTTKRDLPNLWIGNDGDDKYIGCPYRFVAIGLAVYNPELYIPRERIRALIEKERQYLNDKGVLAALEALIEEPK